MMTCVKLSLAVIRAGALGDTILTLPAIEHLRRRDVQIEAVGYPHIWRVAGPLVDRVRSIDSATFTHLHADQPDAALHAWVQMHDQIVAWTARDPRTGLRNAGVPAVIWTPPYPPPDVHAAAWLLGSVGGDAGRLSAWRLPLSDRECREGRSALAQLGALRPVLVHPGAGAGWKRWPADHFARVVRRLAEGGQEVALVRGPADTDAVAAVQRKLPAPLPVLHVADLRYLAGALGQARLFLGNDSGTTHLAAASGVPTVALFGPTDPACWAPPAARVIRACTARAEHAGQIRVCTAGTCMEEIGPEMVLDVLAGLL